MPTPRYQRVTEILYGELWAYCRRLIVGDSVRAPAVLRAFQRTYNAYKADILAHPQMTAGIRASLPSNLRVDGQWGRSSRAVAQVVLWAETNLDGGALTSLPDAPTQLRAWWLSQHEPRFRLEENIGSAVGNVIQTVEATPAASIESALNQLATEYIVNNVGMVGEPAGDEQFDDLISRLASGTSAPIVPSKLPTVSTKPEFLPDEFSVPTRSVNFSTPLQITGRSRSQVPWGFLAVAGVASVLGVVFVTQRKRT
jgi:hypothetical protein